MDNLAAIKREEKKLEKQLGKLQRQLNGVRAAAKALGDSTFPFLPVRDSAYRVPFSSLHGLPYRT